MKKIKIHLAIAVLSVGLLTSCATINSGASLAEKAPIGLKMGEAKSTLFLGLWTSKGEENNIRKAAENGGIKKVTQVEYVNTSYFWGFIITHVTRVYGE